MRRDTTAALGGRFAYVYANRGADTYRLRLSPSASRFDFDELQRDAESRKRLHALDLELTQMLGQVRNALFARREFDLALGATPAAAFPHAGWRHAG
jgi:hypothetical protein